MSAELTARVRHGNFSDATTEIIDACRAADVMVTILKGMSIAEEHYPAPHLRPMGDIDILVAESERERVEAAVLGLGYLRESDYRPPDDPHHGPPLYQPERRVWLEIHTALFPSGSALSSGRLFGPSQIRDQSVIATFSGMPVHRLSSEVQLAYIASYWMRDLCRNKIHPAFVMPLVDAAWLLGNAGEQLEWDAMLGWLDNEMAAASLYLMLAYFSRHDLFHADTTVLRRLASRQSVVGTVELRVIDALLDRYLVEGKPFPRWFSDWNASIVLGTLMAPGAHIARWLWLPCNLAFPPGVPGRYSVRHQFDRVTRRLRGRS